jgi:hypothetical protein
MNVPRDYILNELWKHLPYNDIISLCQSSKELNIIYISNATWVFLLQRDFGIADNYNAHNMYLLYKGALDLLTSYFPIVTQRALLEFVTYIPKSQWTNIISALNRIKIYYENEYKIFSIQMLRFIFDMKDDYRRCVVKVIDQQLQSSVELIKSIYPDYNNIVIMLTTKPLTSVVSYDTIVFINGKLTLVHYDYELAFMVEKYLNVTQRDDLKQIVEDLLELT